MPEFTVSWLELARGAYDDLLLDRRHAIDDRLRMLVSDPTSDGQRDPTTGWWTTTYANETGLLLYGVSERHRRIVVLRLQDFT